MTRSFITLGLGLCSLAPSSAHAACSAVGHPDLDDRQDFFDPFPGIIDTDVGDATTERATITG